MLFNEQVNMSEPQVSAPAPPASGPPTTAERAAVTHSTPGRTMPQQQQSATSTASQHNNKSERYGSNSQDHGNKHTHKTYVRGRGHQRGNSRR